MPWPKPLGEWTPTLAYFFQFQILCLSRRRSGTPQYTICRTVAAGPINLWGVKCNPNPYREILKLLLHGRKQVFKSRIFLLGSGDPLQINRDCDLGTAKLHDVVEWERNPTPTSKEYDWAFVRKAVQLSLVGTVETVQPDMDMFVGHDFFQDLVGPSTRASRFDMESKLVLCRPSHGDGMPFQHTDAWNVDKDILPSLAMNAGIFSHFDFVDVRRDAMRVCLDRPKVGQIANGLVNYKHDYSRDEIL